MIYEVRTYDLKPRSIVQAEEAFAEALPHREKYGPIAAFWHTEIGPLNQIIHVWAYENLAERDSVRAAAGKDPNWPPKITPGNILNMNSEIWHPAPFMRPMGGDQALGGIYEMRTYTYEPGSIPGLLERWEAAIENREKYSPLAAGMYTEFGGLNRWMHVWPYRDLAHRDEVRGTKIEGWPSGAPGMIRQENKIMVPSSFSPMH
jgi:hypothetical protein|tara:strand:- start:1117 stop:1728 length:612 start_codon:yes stop_codon:yes gene_type:complete